MGRVVLGQRDQADDGQEPAAVSVGRTLARLLEPAKIGGSGLTVLRRNRILWRSGLNCWEMVGEETVCIVEK
ncbi:unnamed protein product [Nesidiocoris tenuis]|uniref:Uncharacterized protein n=1 Tax=Nesidiocoris tenuis TaxID=355587 RepID=A0A6H5HHP1_9HEMI|nr:unnamed protein product [Nesidiocoris tenuis]